MNLTEYENEVMLAVLPRLKEYEQIKLILNADFSTENSENKDELNAYRKNSVLYSLIYPYCKLFHIGRTPGMYFKKDVDALESFLHAYLAEMQFVSGFLSGVKNK